MALPSISSFFASKPAQPAQQAQQPNPQGGQGGAAVQQPNPINGASDVQGPGTPATPGNGQTTQSQQPADPLASYTKMWDTPSTEGNGPPQFKIDPKVLDDVSGQQDFMKGVNPELMQRATSGDSSALIELIHATSRNAYKHAIEHGGLLTDKFVSSREEFSSKGLGDKVRSELTTHALSDTHNFQNPVVRKQLTEIAQRLQRQHPDAAPQEIAKQAKQYLTDLVAAMQDPKAAAATQAANGPQETNWDAFFDGPQES